MAKKDLMLTKKDIENAIKESELVKKDYPAFWKFYEMVMEMNQDLSALQDALENDKKAG